MNRDRKLVPHTVGLFFSVNRTGALSLSGKRTDGEDVMFSGISLSHKWKLKNKWRTFWKRRRSEGLGRRGEWKGGKRSTVAVRRVPVRKCCREHHRLLLLLVCISSYGCSAAANSGT